MTHNFFCLGCNGFSHLNRGPKVCHHGNNHAGWELTRKVVKRKGIRAPKWPCFSKMLIVAMTKSGPNFVPKKHSNFDNKPHFSRVSKKINQDFSWKCFQGSILLFKEFRRITRCWFHAHFLLFTPNLWEMLQFDRAYFSNGLKPKPATRKTLKKPDHGKRNWLGVTTVEEILNNHLGCIPNLVKNGRNYQPPLVSRISEPSTVWPPLLFVFWHVSKDFLCSPLFGEDSHFD